MISLKLYATAREGTGNPLQCSCLENPRDGGAWWAAVYGVAQNWTWLTWLSSSSICHSRILNRRAIPTRSTSGVAQRLLTKPTKLLSSLSSLEDHTPPGLFEYSQSWEAKWINEGRIIGKSKVSNPSARNGFKKHSNSQTQRTDLWLPRGREYGGGMDWEFGVSRCKLLCFVVVWSLSCVQLFCDTYGL